MATDKTLTIEPGAWNEEVGELLAAAAPRGSLADIRAQVEAGQAKLYLVKHDGAPVGAFVLRVDHAHGGDEGVIVAGAGRLPGTDLIETCIPHIETLFQGCARIRYHTGKPALARKLMRQGYAPREIVSTKELKHVFTA